MTPLEPAAPAPDIAVQYAPLPDAVLPPRAQVRTWVKAALAAANCSGEVAVRFVGEAEMAALNGKYRGKPQPTNVLSFDYRSDDGAVLGDVLVCAPLVQQEAQQRRLPALAHYAHLVVHGVLHLTGQRHDTPTRAAVMESLEVRALHTLNIDNPYQ